VGSSTNTSYSGFPTELLEVEISGVAEALVNLTERGAIDPVVKATISLSESGFASVPEAVVYGEIKDESITGKSVSHTFSSLALLPAPREIEESLWSRVFRYGIIHLGNGVCFRSTAVAICINIC
jgi:hypothetical protein